MELAPDSRPTLIGLLELVPQSLIHVYKYTLRDILCSGLTDLFTSWFIFIVVICHWPNGLVSEAHIINHGGHYCSIITLSLSELSTFPACALSISVYNINTHGQDVVSCKVLSTPQYERQQKCYVCIAEHTGTY